MFSVTRSAPAARLRRIISGLPGILFCALLADAISGPVHAQSGLTPFTDSKGCKLLVFPGSVARLEEIAAQGTVTWVGACRAGFIDGMGVLRQEGTTTVSGKSKRYAYFLSGEARKGIRLGTWKRETFDRFVDSPRFYTSAATISFVNGVTRGGPKLLKVTRMEQFTPAFRRFVSEAGKDAVPGNSSLQITAPAATPAISPATATPAPAPKAPDAPVAPVAPPATPRGDAAISSKPVPQSPAITASSQTGQFGPEGILAGAQPGWHAANPPRYPEWVMVDFRKARPVSRFALLAQDGHPERGPRGVRFEVSSDDVAWTPVAVVGDACAPNTAGGWASYALPATVTARYIKVFVFSNCGDPDLLTIRGLRVE